MEGRTNMTFKDDKEEMSREPFIFPEAVLGRELFKDQYEQQNFLDKLDDTDVQYRVEDGDQIVISGKRYSDVDRVIKQLYDLKLKSESEDGQQSEDSVHSVVERPLNVAKDNSKEPGRPERKIRQLKVSSEIPFDEHMWCYLNELNTDRIKDIEHQHGCRLAFSDAASCIKVSTNVTDSENFDKEMAEKRLGDATEAFAEIYQETSKENVKEEIWRIPSGLCEERERELLNVGREMNFVLVPVKVYRAIGPVSKFREVTEKLQQHFKDDGSNWIRFQRKDEPFANSHDIRFQPPQKEWDGVKQSPSTRTPSTHKANDHETNAKGILSETLQFTTPGGINVRVAQGDLVRQSVDAIVNPANSSLRHGGGAARVISRAAGESMEKECRDYIRKHDRLNLTCVTHTTSGNLRPNIRHVIHAVGPEKTQYTSDERLYKDVKQTVYNCLAYANTFMKIKSVAIPAISSGIYGVPLEIVAKSSFDALMKFDKESKGKSKDRTLQDVNFVNIDEPTFTFMRNTFAELSAKDFGSSVDPPKNHVNHGQYNVGATSSDRVVQHQPSSSSSLSEYQDSKPLKNSTREEANDMHSKHKPKDTKTEKPSGDEEDKLCIICMDEFTDPVTLDCKHKFCRQCIDDCFSKHQPKCPSCGRVFGAMRGTQPKGTMSVSENSFIRLPGFSDCGAIEITYHFPNGVQGEEHPNPGQRYKGTTRTAYLPANQEGREILKLLRKAFDAQLVFTIGRSNTTGQENVVIWNDVHHKTSISGQYGYPDPTYLKRVREELAAKGIQ